MFNDFNHAKICQVPKNPNDGFLWIIAQELDTENDHNVHTGYTPIFCIGFCSAAATTRNSERSAASLVHGSCQGALHLCTLVADI